MEPDPSGLGGHAKQFAFYSESEGARRVFHTGEHSPHLICVFRNFLWLPWHEAILDLGGETGVPILILVMELLKGWIPK